MTAPASPAFETLRRGNEYFRAFVNANHPQTVFEERAREQTPPFMVIGCADSRVSEGTVFGALPGTIFAQRNIANQFLPDDQNAQSALHFAVESLGVTHIIVLGHSNCGGCRAAMNVPAPTPPVEHPVLAWIAPIAGLYTESQNEAILDFKTNLAPEHAPFDGVHDLAEDDNACPALEALIRANVRANVERVRAAPVLANRQVLVYGLVYNINNGEIIEVNVPDYEVPPSGFRKVAN